MSGSKALGTVLAGAARGITRLFGARVGARAAAHASSVLAPVVTVETARGRLRFHCGSAMAARQAVGFLNHEPATRQWIEVWIAPGACLWDVGANVGAYTLYACLADRVTAVSFEPVAGTFAHLVQNLALNGFETRATPLCAALSNTTGIQPIYLTSTEPGTAMHALAAPENMRGIFEAAGTQMVGAFRGDDLARQLHIAPPDHIKIDVDGHELKVLEGMGDLLNDVRTIWIEMEDSADDSAIEDLLAARGFVSKSLEATSGRNRLFVNQRYSR